MSAARQNQWVAGQRALQAQDTVDRLALHRKLAAEAVQREAVARKEADALRNAGVSAKSDAKHKNSRAQSPSPSPLTGATSKPPCGDKVLAGTFGDAKEGGSVIGPSGLRRPARPTIPKSRRLGQRAGRWASMRATEADLCGEAEFRVPKPPVGGDACGQVPPKSELRAPISTRRSEWHRIRT